VPCQQSSTRTLRRA